MTAVQPSNRLYWELPKEARNLIDCLGWELALVVIEAFGGMRLSVPSARRTPTGQGAELLELVGQDGLEKLRGVFGRSDVDIPLCQALKRERAWLMRKEGKSLNVIAKQIGVDRNTACRWIKLVEQREQPPAAEPGPQMSLF